MQPIRCFQGLIGEVDMASSLASGTSRGSRRVSHSLEFGKLRERVQTLQARPEGDTHMAREATMRVGKAQTSDHARGSRPRRCFAFVLTLALALVF